MRALFDQLKFRILASLVLALAGNSSAASNIEKNVLNFKATSPVMRPQTKRMPKFVSDDPDDEGILATTIVNTVILPPPVVQPPPSVTLPAPVFHSPAVTTPPLVATPPPPKIAAPPPGVAAPAPASPSTFDQPGLTSQGSNPMSNAPVPLPKSRPAIAEPDNQLHAGIIPGCPDGTCAKGPHRNPATPIPSKVAGLDDGTYHSAQEKCYSQALVAAAKVNVASRYGNRPKSAGLCALGVRTSINRAGIYGGSLGNAVDYQARGKAAAIGFKNYISEYGNDMSRIPAGAILVFAGPQTATYLRTGYEGPRGGKGTFLGHVTIKGDDGRYYTDGRTVNPAIGWPGDKATRRLVGVYLMQQCTASCSSSLRQRCG
jgi:hypothetical protein